MNEGKTIFALVLGAAVGSLITWKLVTDKYERIISDIYAECEEEYEKDEVVSDETSIQEVHTEAFEEMNREIDEYEEKVAQFGYGAAFDKSEPSKDEATDDENEEGDGLMGSRVVSPEEFDECEYPVVEFTYYSDGFLADEDDEIVSDIANTVGKDFSNHFGDYDEDPDTVYVINDDDQVCYEICRDNRKYMDVRARFYDDSTED